MGLHESVALFFGLDRLDRLGLGGLKGLLYGDYLKLNSEASTRAAVNRPLGRQQPKASTCEAESTRSAVNSEA